MDPVTPDCFLTERVPLLSAAVFITVSYCLLAAMTLSRAISSHTMFFTVLVLFVHRFRRNHYFRRFSATVHAR